MAFTIIREQDQAFICTNGKYVPCPSFNRDHLFQVLQFRCHPKQVFWQCVGMANLIICLLRNNNNNNQKQQLHIRLSFAHSLIIMSAMNQQCGKTKLKTMMQHAGN